MVKMVIYRYFITPSEENTVDDILIGYDEMYGILKIMYLYECIVYVCVCGGRLPFHTAVYGQWKMRINVTKGTFNSPKWEDLLFRSALFILVGIFYIHF